MKIKIGDYVYSLSTLPNQSGFKFVGIRMDRAKADCHVIKDLETGFHKIAGDAGYHDLIGWIRKC